MALSGNRGGPPSNNQVELTLIGPGYGESCLIHIGGNQWIIIDSAIDIRSGEPAALEYLRQIGVSPEDAVRLIIITHWHDDHIRGISKIVSECVKAKICFSAAFQNEDIVTTIAAFNSNNVIGGGSGTTEMHKVLTEARLTRRVCMRAMANRVLLSVNADTLPHGFSCCVTSLSPSDKELSLAIVNLSRILPKKFQGKSRIPDPSPNDTSVVNWISIGSLHILLGADLEEHADPDRGWSAIIADSNRPMGQATLFKVPHHGSENGHHAEIWNKLLAPAPIALVAPWNRSRGLPTASDVARITGLTSSSFVTATTTASSVRRRSLTVEKTARETVGRIRPSQGHPGRITLRSSLVPPFDIWSIDLQDGARPLYDLSAGYA